MAVPNLERGFIGQDNIEATLAESTISNRDNAIRNFEKFMVLFPDLMQPPLTEDQSRICELFAKKKFNFIFEDNKKLYFEEKLTILQNFIFNAEKYKNM